MPGPVSEAPASPPICRCEHFRYLHGADGACSMLGDPDYGCTCRGYEEDPDPALYRELDDFMAGLTEEDDGNE